MQTQSYRHWRYSPLQAGVFVIPLAGLIRLLAAAIDARPLPRAWIFYIVAGLAVSLVLHFASTRVLFSRLLDLAAAVLLLAALWSFAHAVLLNIFASPNLLWPVIAGVILVLGFVVGFVRDQRSWLRSQLPCGYEGRLDERTGTVDPTAPTPQQPSQAVAHNLVKNPVVQLVAGIVLAQLAMAFLPPTLRLTVLLALLAYLLAVFAFATGRVASVCAATRRWERQHGKQIRVAR